MAYRHTGALKCHFLFIGSRKKYLKVENLQMVSVDDMMKKSIHLVMQAGRGKVYLTRKCADDKVPVKDRRLEERHKKYREILKNLTIMSDMFMRNVLKQIECTEYILQVMMGDCGLKVVEQVLQKDYKNLQGRSAVLDCVACDGRGRQFNVEIQQDSEGASPKRARYHSGLMDMNTLNPGQNFNELPENYVIFITREDELGQDLPICHIDRRIRETSQDFMDGSHIVYVNSSSQEDTELGRLMHDLHCKRAEEMYSEILAKRVYELKETQEGVNKMCQEMEQIFSEGQRYGEKRGEKKGALKAKKETAVSLNSMGLPVEKIAEAVKVSAATVQKWLGGNVTTAR